MLKRWRRFMKMDEETRAEKARKATEFGMFNAFAFSQSVNSVSRVDATSIPSNQKLAALHMVSQTWND